MLESPLVSHDDYTLTVSIDNPVTLEADFSISQALAEQLPEAVETIYSQLQPCLEPLLIETFQEIRAVEKPVPVVQQLAPHQCLELAMLLCTNEEIKALNTAYRDKPQATDVLTFSFSEDGLPLNQLPVVDLGQIVVSLEWALENSSQVNILGYVAERLIHGLLHINGIHHDTEKDYEQVVGMQQKLLSKLLQ